MTIEGLNNIIEEDIPWLTSDNYKDWKQSFDVDIDTPHWRHYEMVSDIGGIVAFEDRGKVVVKFFEGDDGNYWADNLNLMMDAFWIKFYKKAIEQMYDWLEKNCEKDEFGYKGLKKNNK